MMDIYFLGLVKNFITTTTLHLIDFLVKLHYVTSR